MWRLPLATYNTTPSQNSFLKWTDEAGGAGARARARVRLRKKKLREMEDLPKHKMSPNQVILQSENLTKVRLNLSLYFFLHFPELQFHKLLNPFCLTQNAVVVYTGDQRLSTRTRDSQRAKECQCKPPCVIIFLPKF